MSTQRPPLPPFTLETAIEKVRLAEDGWNSRDPEKIALAYTVDSYWRNRVEFVLTIFGEPRSGRHRSACSVRPSTIARNVVCSDGKA